MAGSGITYNPRFDDKVVPIGEQIKKGVQTVKGIGEEGIQSLKESPSSLAAPLELQQSAAFAKGIFDKAAGLPKPQQMQNLTNLNKAFRVARGGVVLPLEIANIGFEAADLGGTGEDLYTYTGRNIGEKTGEFLLGDASAPAISVKELEAAYDKLQDPEVSKEDFIKRALSRGMASSVEQGGNVPEFMKTAESEKLRTLPRTGAGSLTTAKEQEARPAAPGTVGAEGYVPMDTSTSDANIEKALAGVSGLIDVGGKTQGVTPTGESRDLPEEAAAEFREIMQEPQGVTREVPLKTEGQQIKDDAQAAQAAQPDQVAQPTQPTQAASAAQPQGIPATAQAGSPQANFLQRLQQGALSPEEIQAAQAYAASIGTTFDPATGYSRQPFLGAQQGMQMPQMQQMQQMPQMQAPASGMQFTTGLQPSQGIGGFDSVVRDRDIRPADGRQFKDSELRDIFGGGDKLKAAKAMQRAGINPVTQTSFAEEEATIAAKQRSGIPKPREDKYQTAMDAATKYAQSQGIDLNTLEGQSFLNQIALSIFGNMGEYDTPIYEGPYLPGREPDKGVPEQPTELTDDQEEGLNKEQSKMYQAYLKDKDNPEAQAAFQRLLGQIQ